MHNGGPEKYFPAREIPNSVGCVPWPAWDCRILNGLADEPHPASCHAQCFPGPLTQGVAGVLHRDRFRDQDGETRTTNGEVISTRLLQSVFKSQIKIHKSK